MAWFGRKQKVSDETDEVVESAQPEESVPVKDKKSKKDKKEKGSLFRRRKNMTLIERMQLQESVADGSLEAVQIYLQRRDSAVREVDEGILIIAVTNELLDLVGLDPSSEEFGSFVQALHAETIDSITLTEDLENGVIGIIPSADTIDALDEFEFAHEIPFRWAIVPPDLTDDSRLILLDTQVRMDLLVILRDNQDLQLRIENGEVVEIPDESAVDNDYSFYNEPSSNHSFYAQDDDEEDDDSASYPAYNDDEEDDDSAGYPVYDEDEDNENTGYPLFDDEDFDGEDDEDNIFTPVAVTSFDVDDDEVQQEETEILSPEETQQVITDRAEYLFTNTELGLKIDPDKFNAFFAAPTHVHFDTSRSEDDGELGRAILQMRRNANTEIDRFHQETVQTLFNEFIVGMNDIHEKIVHYADHLRDGSVYSSKYEEIESTLRGALNDIDRLSSEASREITEQYEHDRDTYAENAKREAMAVYDLKYGDEHRQRISAVKERLRQDFKTTRDIELGELYNDRRVVARRLFDAGAASLLQTLQVSYQEMMQKELTMFDIFRKDMDMYMRRHFADEVLRAKAEAEKLKQSHEADRVRQEYEQILTTRTRQMEELDTKARKELERLELSHKDQLELLRKEHSVLIQREKQQVEELRFNLQETMQNMTKLADQKEEEIAQRIAMYERTIESKDRELQYATNQKPVRTIFMAIAAIMLTLGIIAGFMVGVSSAHQNVVDQPVYVQPVTNSPAASGTTTPSGS